jgi:hydroxyacylglutathione hydrolase
MLFIARQRLFARRCCRGVSGIIGEKIDLVRQACADVHIIPVLDDNYSYVIKCRATGAAACIDPGDAPPIIDRLASISKDNKDFKLQYVLCTHKHWDHTDGTGMLKQNFKDISVVGTGYEHIPFLDRPLKHDDTLSVGRLTVRAIHTPCHTKGHVCFLVTGTEGSPILFSGDTLFAGGCGRFFEGTGADMLANMNIFEALPGNTQVYCGHEYTLSNMKFLRSIDPDRVSPFFEKAKYLREANHPTVPTTIADEQRYNLFMRCNDVELQNRLSTKNSLDTMNKLREQKNNF